MNGRLEERDRFTALGERRFKRITDKVIEEVLAAALREEKGRSNPKYDTEWEISHSLFRADVLYEMLTRFCLFSGICATFFFFCHRVLPWNWYF